VSANHPTIVHIDPPAPRPMIHIVNHNDFDPEITEIAEGMEALEDHLREDGERMAPHRKSGLTSLLIQTQAGLNVIETFLFPGSVSDNQKQKIKCELDAMRTRLRFLP
jgi:hypothetical protein